MLDEQLIQRIEGKQEQFEDVLVNLTTDDVYPVLGFMQQQYGMDGPVQKSTRPAPIMNTVTSEVSQ